MNYNTLDYDELLALKRNLESVLCTQLFPTLITLNQNERLGRFLDLLDQRELIAPDESGFVSLPDKNILLLGHSKLKDEFIYKTFTEIGISKNRVELHTEYKPDRVNIDSLKYSTQYSLILLGPMPHSMPGKGDFSSVIVRLETEDGFPPVKRITVNGELKITKSSLKSALASAIERKWISIY